MSQPDWYTDLSKKLRLTWQRVFIGGIILGALFFVCARKPLACLGQSSKCESRRYFLWAKGSLSKLVWKSNNNSSNNSNNNNSSSNNQDNNNNNNNKNNDSYPITITTAYFKFKSKFDSALYMEWAENFLSMIERTAFVIHTSPDLVPKLRELRKKCKNAGPTKFVEHKDIWSVPWFQRQVVVNGTVQANETWRTIYTKQNYKDREKHLHPTPELYAIWNAKPWFVNYAITKNPFNSKYFFWVDIGCFRTQNHPFKHWPSPSFVEDSLGSSSSRVFVAAVKDAPLYNEMDKFKEDNGPQYVELIEGGFFAGTSTSLQWYYNEFTRLHDKYCAMGFFIGKDQDIMNAIFFKDPNRFAVISAFRIQGHCGDPYFYFEHIFASEREGYSGCAKRPFLLWW